MKVRKIRIAGDLGNMTLPIQALSITDVESGELLPVLKIHSIAFSPGEPIKATVTLDVYVGSLDLTADAEIVERDRPHAA